MEGEMKKSAVVPSIIAVTLTLPLLFAVPVVFAQAGGRGGGGGGVGSGSRGGGVVGGSGGVVGGAGRAGVIGGGSRGSFHLPSSRFRHHHFRRNVFVFGFGASAFVPAWWWYDPYSYWGAPPAYYSAYYGYPSYDYYGYPSYDYYGYPYWSDPCLSPDPADAPYCPPVNYPYQGGYGAPPVDYPPPAAPAQPESGSQWPSPPAPGQPTSLGN